MDYLHVSLQIKSAIGVHGHVRAVVDLMIALEIHLDEIGVGLHWIADDESRGNGGREVRFGQRERSSKKRCRGRVSVADGTAQRQCSASELLEPTRPSECAAQRERVISIHGEILPGTVQGHRQCNHVIGAGTIQVVIRHSRQRDAVATEGVIITGDDDFIDGIIADAVRRGIARSARREHQRNARLAKLRRAPGGPIAVIAPGIVDGAAPGVGAGVDNCCPSHQGQQREG